MAELYAGATLGNQVQWDKHPFFVKIYTPDNAHYPAIFEEDDLETAILIAWRFARKPEVWYTQVITPVQNMLAQFSLKEMRENEMVNVPNNPTE